MPDAITCRGVTRTYRAAAGSVEALHAVDAAFPSAALTAVTGPSGCGKSTLLHLLAGVDRADTGVIDVAGTRLTSLAPRGLRRYRRDGAAYVAQHAAANLVPHLTVAEQLGSYRGPLLGLETRLSARADELSGGEQARAALAVAISRGTPFVLVDEPTAELDRTTAHTVIEVLRQLVREGRTVVVATHDPDLVDVAESELTLMPVARGADPVAARGGRPRAEASVLALRDLTKGYGGRRVVDGASLQLGRGELAVLLGRSGSGKSTLLMMAGGWIAPDAGELVAPGSRWDETSYLAQRFGLLPELSAGENIALPLRLRGGGGLDRELAGRLDVAELLERAPSETSLGQQQRIALARALVLSPTLLLADEPTSHQDSHSADRVWSELRSACEAGTACLVATHDERLAERADRVWLIEDGRVRPG